MPKLDIALVPERNSTSYPEPFRAAVSGRFWRALGQAAGLTQFGVNLVRLEPGAWSSQRHWHENEGETILRAGDAACFKAGVPNGHHLLNRTERDGVFLVVGSRAPAERAHYPDLDLLYEKTDGRVRYTDRAGRPFA